MNRFRLFLLLRKQNSLSLRRSPAFEQSVVAKVMTLLGAGFMIIYLIFIGTMMGLPASESKEYGLLLSMMPLWMVIDFFSRFVVQQTPAMTVKPYLLQPIPFGSVVETYLVNAMLTGYNFMWLALLLPYAFVVWCGGASFYMSLMIVVCGELLFMVNSLIYLMVRTLIGRSLLWWILPIVVYGAFWVTLLFDEDLFGDQLEWLSEITTAWWFPLFVIVLLGGVFFLNRSIQYRFVREEVMRVEKGEKAMKNVTQFQFLSTFGQTGEYLKLELKSIMRNKAIRSRVIMSFFLIIVLTLLITYTSVYDSKTMLNFWCFYCFGIYGMTALVKVMGPEGNYIDLLMTQKENILSLLRAKYYIHVCILFVPFLLMLPAVIAGKFSLLMMVSYMLLCSGLLYFMLFQLAVYNKQTLPLNQKLTGKGNVENGIQMIIQMVAMFTPLVLVSAFILLFSETMAYILLGIIGLLLTLTHPLWLRNIYNRMMQRKYVNLEGFHASR